MDLDIRNTFINISRIQTFAKSCTLHNYSFTIFRSFFSPFCAVTPSLCGSTLLKRTTTHLGQLRESTGEFRRSAQGTPKLTIKKLRPARFTLLAQFIITELYSLMFLLIQH